MLNAMSWPTVSSPAITRCAPSHSVIAVTSLPTNCTDWLPAIPSTTARNDART